MSQGSGQGPRVKLIVAVCAVWDVATSCPRSAKPLAYRRAACVGLEGKRPPSCLHPSGSNSHLSSWLSR